MTIAQDLRSRSDLELATHLLEHPDVKRVIEELERRQDDGPLGTRRRLLATSVRLSEAMAPRIHAMARDCAERLGVEIPLEIYVYASASFNAACVKPEDGRLFIMFSSSLLEAFSHSELQFVMGHELGHYLYAHHDVPIGYLLQGQPSPSPDLSLQLFAWSRYAEISADRAGAYCSDGFEDVGRALFRLASGLGDQVIEFRIQDFLKQIDEMQTHDAENAGGAPMEDWFSTHPFSPLRVKALALYYASAFVSPDGNSREALEADVQSLMGLMEPSYLESRTEAAEAMRRLLFAGAIAIADAVDGVSDEEAAAFEKFFGKHAFKDSFDLTKIKASLPDRIEKALELASHGQCAQVVRDLCVIARADQRVAPQERQQLNRIASDIGISQGFVERCISATTELD